MAKRSSSASKPGRTKDAKKNSKKKQRILSEEEILKFLEDLVEDFGDDHTDEFLLYVAHESERVRAAAIRALWEGELDRVWPVIRTAAETDSSEEVRSTAVSVMGRYIYEELLQSEGELEGEELEATPEVIREVHAWLVNRLHSSDSSSLEQRRALEALSFCPGEAEHALMRSWSQHADPDLRMTAIFAMGRSAEPSFAEAILKAYEDPEDRVRREAIRAIGEAGLQEGISILEQALNGSDRDYKLEAISALGELGGQRAMELVNPFLEDKDQEVSELANLAVINMEEAQMMEEWENALQDGDDDDLEDDDEDEDEDGEKRPYRH